MVVTYRGTEIGRVRSIETTRDGVQAVRQQRSPSDQDYPERPAGELYCRIPQDSDMNVLGVRNIPCETKPDKRSPTVELCESDEQ